jgi:hypothetical protein
MKNSFLKRVLKDFTFLTHLYEYSHSQKIFCIGRNKTGTTSMAKMMDNQGFHVGPQRPAELLVKAWGKNDFRKLIKFVKYYGIAFQDVPFSLPNTYKVLDKEFPNSKFILTIRDSSEVWYKSLTRYHSIKFGNGFIPTKQDLIKANYVKKGWMWEVNRIIYNTPETDIYNENLLKKHYQNYNASVIDYFKGSIDKLLVVNLKDPEAGTKICHFLHVDSKKCYVPWENKTKSL